MRPPKETDILNKSLVGLCLIGAVALVPVPAVAQAPTADKQPPMFLEDASPANLPKTIDVFKAEVKAAGWSVLAEQNMAGILSTKGYTLHPLVVLEVCSGKYSAQLLAKDENRFVSSMIPCRVAIYQTCTGKVVISRMNTPVFAAMLGGEVAEAMLKSGNDMGAIIKIPLPS